MAGGAVLVANEAVVKGGAAEVGGVKMATAAGARKVIKGWRMAGGAVTVANEAVVKGGAAEVGGVKMATAASTGKVIRWWGVAGGTITGANDTMVKRGLMPVGGGVTGGAVAAMSALMSVIVGMAGTAGGICAPVDAVCVAGGAVVQGVAAAQREEAVPYHRAGTWRKYDRLASHLAFWRCYGTQQGSDLVGAFSPAAEN